MKKKILTFWLLSALSSQLSAQIGEYRNVFSVGVNGGYTMTTMPFVPKVAQSWYPGFTFGVSGRYTSEKYFSTICSLRAELNYTQAGWKEKIRDLNGNPVQNPRTGDTDRYSKRLNYFQLPILCHLAWGKEEKGFNFFIDAGPQFGYLFAQKTNTNFSCDPSDYDYGNIADRENQVYAQDTIDIKNKFDFGIAAGLGAEVSIRRVGHFLLEGRFYYGLGNIFGASKKDYFQRSNQNAIVIKVSYLFDLTRKRNKKTANIIKTTK